MGPESEDKAYLEEKLAELEILRQSVEQKELKHKETYDQMLRLGADFENYRKRAEERVSQARKYGREEIMAQVLTLSDSLLHAVKACESAEDMDSLKKGMGLVNQQFEKFLKDQGMTPIKSVGEILDPNLHEALFQEENDDVEEGTIVEEIQRGYKMGDQVIRTAKVRVATNSKEKVGQSQESQEEKKHV